MHVAEKIRQTGTEGISMAQDYGNYLPYARNPILIKTYREAECPVRLCFFPALVYIGPVFLDLPAFIFDLTGKAFGGVYFVHKTVWAEARG